MEVGQGDPQQRDPFAKLRGAADLSAGGVIDKVRGQQLVKGGQAAVIEALIDQAPKDLLVLANRPSIPSSSTSYRRSNNGVDGGGSLRLTMGMN